MILWVYDWSLLVQINFSFNRCCRRIEWVLVCELPYLLTTLSTLLCWFEAALLTVTSAGVFISRFLGIICKGNNPVSFFPCLRVKQELFLSFYWLQGQTIFFVLYWLQGQSIFLLLYQFGFPLVFAFSFVKAIFSNNMYIYVCRHCTSRCLKELYTSETTLAQKIVLTPLNNEFVLKIRYSTPIMQKNPQTFLAKISKVTFRAVLALWCKNTKIS